MLVLPLLLRQKAFMIQNKDSNKKDFIGDSQCIDIECKDEIKAHLDVYSKTSAIAGYSVVALLQNLISPIVFKFISKYPIKHYTKSQNKANACWDFSLIIISGNNSFITTKIIIIEAKLNKYGKTVFTIITIIAPITAEIGSTIADILPKIKDFFLLKPSFCNGKAQAIPSGKF